MTKVTATPTKVTVKPTTTMTFRAVKEKREWVIQYREGGRGLWRDSVSCEDATTARKVVDSLRAKGVKWEGWWSQEGQRVVGLDVETKGEERPKDR